MKFITTNKEMLRAYNWAVECAMGYVKEGYPVGPFYEAALPDRNGFCMRDMSHQSVGGHYLGLDEHNKNMIHKFAENVSESKDYCTFWEIVFDGTPYYGDYTSDDDFWYNLPANFDVVRTCYELYNRTGDKSYFTDPVNLEFLRISINEYIERWDRDSDGIVDRVDEDYNRGICSYDEHGKKGYMCALDTYVLEFAAFDAMAKIYGILGRYTESAKAREKAEWLRDGIYKNWWDNDSKFFVSKLNKDGSFGGQFSITNSGFPIRCNMVDDEHRVAQMDYIWKNSASIQIEEQTYLAELLWKCRRNEDAMTVISRITADGYPRREYPEVSYTTVENMVEGYMGIRPNFDENTIETKFGGAEGDIAEITDVPVFGGTVSVKHERADKTVFTNNTGKAVKWFCKTDGGEKIIEVADGETVEG